MLKLYTALCAMCIMYAALCAICTMCTMYTTLCAAEEEGEEGRATATSSLVFAPQVGAA